MAAPHQLVEVDSRSLPDIPNKKGKTNWVEKAGGLPSYIERVAKHLQAKGRTPSVAIATAVNHAKKMCATGTAFGGKTKVSAKAKAVACKAVAEWEAKKASTKVSEADWAQAEMTLEEEIELVEAAATQTVMIEGLLMTLRDRQAGKSNKRRATANAIQLLEGKKAIDWADQDNDFAKVTDRLKRARRELSPLVEAASYAQQARRDVAKLKTKGRDGKPTRDPEFEKKHPRAPKGRTGGGQWIQAGSSGAAVEGVQRELGMKEKAIDGQFGEKTEAAVRAYQEKHGLVVDGIVGSQTAAAFAGEKAPPGALTGEDRQYLEAGDEEDPKNVKEASIRQAGGNWQWRDRVGKWINMPDSDIASTIDKFQHLGPGGDKAMPPKVKAMLESIKPGEKKTILGLEVERQENGYWTVDGDANLMSPYVAMTSIKQARGTYDPFDRRKMKEGDSRGDHPKRDLDEARVTPWNPALHPRDRTGKFATVLGALKDGEGVELPTGVIVARIPQGSGKGFRVFPKRPQLGDVQRTHDITDAPGAAQFALNHEPAGGTAQPVYGFRKIKEAEMELDCEEALFLRDVMLWVEPVEHPAVAYAREKLAESVERRKASTNGASFASARARENVWRQRLTEAFGAGVPDLNWNPKWHPRSRIGRFVEVPDFLERGYGIGIAQRGTAPQPKRPPTRDTPEALARAYGVGRAYRGLPTAPESNMPALGHRGLQRRRNAYSAEDIKKAKHAVQRKTMIELGGHIGPALVKVTASDKDAIDYLNARREKESLGSDVPKTDLGKMTDELASRVELEQTQKDLEGTPPPEGFNSWRPMVIADSSGKWAGNALRFGTKEEAEKSVSDLMRRWLLVTDTKVEPAVEPPNYKIDSENRQTRIDSPPTLDSDVRTKLKVKPAGYKKWAIFDETQTKAGDDSYPGKLWAGPFRSEERANELLAKVGLSPALPTMDSAVSGADVLGAQPVEDLKERPLYELAAMIKRDWGKQGSGVNFGAKPYLDAMAQLNDINDPYGAEPGGMIVAYFLSNARSWKGETAKKVKAELKRRQKGASMRSPMGSNVPSGSSNVISQTLTNADAEAVGFKSVRVNRKREGAGPHPVKAEGPFVATGYGTSKPGPGFHEVFSGEGDTPEAAIKAAQRSAGISGSEKSTFKQGDLTMEKYTFPNGATVTEEYTPDLKTEWRLDRPDGTQGWYTGQGSKAQALAAAMSLNYANDIDQRFKNMPRHDDVSRWSTERLEEVIANPNVVASIRAKAREELATRRRGSPLGDAESGLLAAPARGFLARFVKEQGGFFGKTGGQRQSLVGRIESGNETAKDRQDLWVAINSAGGAGVVGPELEGTLKRALNDARDDKANAARTGRNAIGPESKIGDKAKEVKKAFDKRFPPVVDAREFTDDLIAQARKNRISSDRRRLPAAPASMVPPAGEPEMRTRDGQRIQFMRDPQTGEASYYLPDTDRFVSEEEGLELMAPRQISKQEYEQGEAIFAQMKREAANRGDRAEFGKIGERERQWRANVQLGPEGRIRNWIDDNTHVDLSPPDAPLDQTERTVEKLGSLSTERLREIISNANADPQLRALARRILSRRERPTLVPAPASDVSNIAQQLTGPQNNVRKRWAGKPGVHFDVNSNRQLIVYKPDGSYSFYGPDGKEVKPKVRPGRPGQSLTGAPFPV